MGFGKKKVNTLAIRQEVSEAFQTVGRQLNDTTIRYVKFNSGLEKKLNAYVQDAAAKAENLKLSNYSKSTDSSDKSNSESDDLKIKVQHVKSEADKFLKSIFDLLDTFFNPRFNPKG